LGALVGLGVFATLQSSHVSLGVRIAAGGAAFAAAGSAALWKYLDYPPRIDAHCKASRSYGNLVREIDIELQASQTQVTEEAMTTIRQAFDQVDSDAPNVSTTIWLWAVSAVARERDDEDHPNATTIERGALPGLKRLSTRLLR